MAGYSAQFVKAQTDIGHRSESAISIGKAAVLYEVFQRIGALDIHFGLQKELQSHEYPFVKRGDQDRRTVSKGTSSSFVSSDVLPDRALSQEVHLGESLKKSFTVDELYKDKLRQGPADDEYVTGCDGRYAGASSKSKVQSQQDGTRMSNSRSNVCDEPSYNEQEASGSHPQGLGSHLEVPESHNDEHHNSNGSGSVYPKEGGNTSGSHSKDLYTSQNGDTALKTSQRTRSKQVTLTESNGTYSHKSGTMERPSTTSRGKTQSSGTENLLDSNSIDIGGSKNSKGSHISRDDAKEVGCSLLSYFDSEGSQSVTCSLPDGVKNRVKRLHVNVWFKRWFLPNLNAAVKCVSQMAVGVGDGLRSYFTPLQMQKPTRKFEEVYLSSLEYAILKDDLTRCYFNIDNDYKEHLMLNEAENFRRLYMRKRITFNEFCEFFHPYLSQNKEDYTRNKQTEFNEEPLQNKAIQHILEKSIYGLSIENPNEFFRKNCSIKPYQMLEPIPHK